MIVLGIDPGDTLIGYGVIKKTGSKLSLVDCGCVKTKTGAKAGEKLHELEEKLTEVILKHKPSLCGVEDIFFFKNFKTAIKVAQARGVILATCRRHNIEISEFTPLQIKQAVTGYGQAQKKQVQKMVGLILKLDEPIVQDDTADAVAAAICAANSYICSSKSL